MSRDDTYNILRVQMTDARLVLDEDAQWVLEYTPGSITIIFIVIYMQASENLDDQRWVDENLPWLIEEAMRDHAVFCENDFQLALSYALEGNIAQGYTEYGVIQHPTIFECSVNAVGRVSFTQFGGQIPRVSEEIASDRRSSLYFLKVTENGEDCWVMFYVGSHQDEIEGKSFVQVANDKQLVFIFDYQAALDSLHRLMDTYPHVGVHNLPAIAEHNGAYALCDA